MGEAQKQYALQWILKYETVSPNWQIGLRRGDRSKERRKETVP